MSVVEVSTSNADVDATRSASPDDEEEELDPRIKENLDRLNFASDEINRLEKKQDEIRQANRLALSEFSQQCQILKKKYGKSIEKSSPYYNARMAAKKALHDNQRAAMAFEKASDHLKAAKKSVEIAEREMLTSKDGQKPVFDSAWQDALNQATSKVLEVENEKAKFELEHRRAAKAYDEARQRVALLLRKFRSSIDKSRAFYEARAVHRQKSEKFRKQVLDLVSHIKSTKETYSQSLDNLEMISREIHESRQAKKLREKIEESERKRDRGDGAEEVDIHAELDEVDGVARSLSISLGLTPASQLGSMSSLRSGDQYQVGVESLEEEEGLEEEERKVSGDGTDRVESNCVGENERE